MSESAASTPAHAAPGHTVPLAAAVAGYWDAVAASFDDEPDHGLRDARVREAWAARLGRWLPVRGRGGADGLDVLDAGCGTGSLSLLMAASGHRVTGVDLSARMVERAREKFAAAGLAGHFLTGDAAAPPAGAAVFDAVIARHLLWTLPDPPAALRTWCDLLRPGGTLILVEGRWGESATATPYVAGAGALPWGGGVGAEELLGAVRPLVGAARIEELSGEAALWGRAVTDERYALTAVK
ncbi:methyltransferase domain-containing protein [Streptomyces sp. CAU 1734]|uniref:class I SAM-dependent methyltransferase n=1 Tax=Streptomyces sp. CAU 1734 TaxID=3140360 RepID=UPI00326183FD